MRIAGPLVLCLIATIGCADLEPWASKTLPSDQPRAHRVVVSAGETRYAVRQGGTMDGDNCRPPIGYAAWTQPWESNRSVRMENTGDTDVLNPWLYNGKNNLRTIHEIIGYTIEPGMTDREKALALWIRQMNQRFHAYTADNEVNDPVKVYNVYGYTLCGNDAICLAGLWKSAGLPVAPCRPIGHSITQVFFDDAWHVIDGDEHCIFLLRDNQTIASEAQVGRDHDLIKRTHTYGILSGDSRTTDEFSASLYINEEPARGDRDCARGHTMNMVLRPGEALTWRWGHLEPVKFHGYEAIRDWGQHAIDKICNGLWEYRPDLTRDLWRQGALEVQGVATTDDGLVPEAGQTGTVTWRIAAPYVFVGGRIEAAGQGARFAVSWDRKQWQPVEADLDALFPPDSPARYEYFLRCELPPGASLRSLAIINDLQMAYLSLPGMSVGQNEFVYTDDNKGPRTVAITHEWVERSISSPPAAPERCIFPADGAQVEGTKLVFRWEAPAAPEGHEIADYQFQLADHPEMKWALSPNFSKLISNTGDRGNARFTLPSEGLLAPERVYYWRVRARNSHQLWSEWGPVWRFSVNGPAVPVSVRIELDRETGSGVLLWEPNPGGRRPVQYRVYGSDEKGFTASDEPYTVNVGNQEFKLPNPFPANLVALTDARTLTVVGAGVELPNANKAYYRVVAVDEKGNRSCPSDSAEVPRPLIYTRPPDRAHVGEPYRYAPGCIRSLGDLRCRSIGGNSYNACFWDVEQPVWEIEQGPDWLGIDPETGVVSGTPRSVGACQITVKASLGKPGEARQEFVVNVAE